MKQKLGARIQEIRKSKNLTQKVLAEKFDMDKSNLSNIECGKRFMTAETLEKLAGASLKSTSDKLNIVSQEIQELETLLSNQNKPQQYRILTYNYFKDLCHNGSNLLTHSSLAEKRAFVEKFIEVVTFESVRKTVNVKLNINPF